MKQKRNSIFSIIPDQLNKTKNKLEEKKVITPNTR